MTPITKAAWIHRHYAAISDIERIAYLIADTPAWSDEPDLSLKILDAMTGDVVELLASIKAKREQVAASGKSN